jgi:hypothetical protein
MQNLVYDAEGVAGALGLSSAKDFHNRRRRLERFEAFPKPLPYTPLRWSCVEVDRWIAGDRAPRSEAPAAPEPPRRNAAILRLENRGRAA